MRNIRLVLSYDGAAYSGWQVQPDRRTLQETLEKAILELTGEEKVHATASGRTDAGVHALAQVVNFHTRCTLSAGVMQCAINARLPDDIRVLSTEEVALEFDAGRDAKRKLYRYVIHDGPIPNVFLQRYSCHSRRALDVDAMRRGAEYLRGKHDFRCFETEWPNRASSVRTITHLALSRVGDWIWLDVEADGFLYNMVRAIAGTLMNVGRGYWPPEQVRDIIEAKDRQLAGPTAPAQGLFLVRVTFTDASLIQQR